jgi:hypothetical protein
VFERVCVSGGGRVLAHTRAIRLWHGPLAAFTYNHQGQCH